MAVSNRVSNATQNYLMPKLVEGVVTGMQGLSYFLVRSQAGDFVGRWKGAQVEVPFKFEKNANGGSFSGFDVLSNGAVDNTIKLTYDAKFYYQSVTLPKTDLSLNMTEKQVANLMKRQISSDTIDLSDKLASGFYGDGTGNLGKDLTGLRAIVDDGTAVSTIGGQSRSTYAQLKATKTASGGTLTLAKMYTAWDNAQAGGQEPDVILTTKTVRSLFNQLVTPNERYQFPTVEMKGRDSIFMGTGARALSFRGAPILADDQCPSGLMFFLNSRSMEFQVLEDYFEGKPVNFAIDEMDGVPTPDVPKGLGFFWTGWTLPTNQEVVTGRVIYAGNFVAKNPRYNTQLTGITGI